MKQNHHQVARQSSRHSAAPQPKTAQSRAKAPGKSAGPVIALFLEGEEPGMSEELVDLTKAEYAALKNAAGNGNVLMFMANAALEKINHPGGTEGKPQTPHDSPACLCIFDPAAGEVVSAIPLAGRELPGVVIAACRAGITVDQFIADAIREKLIRELGASTSNRVQPSHEETGEDAHDRLELATSAVVAAVSVLCDAYWDATDTENEYHRRRACGLISLAYHASSQLEKEAPLACSEWLQTLKTARPMAQRRAA
jgi:hypothetical protein